jgi:hypothetical protein
MVLVLVSSTTPIDLPKIVSTAWTNERPCAYAYIPCSIGDEVSDQKQHNDTHTASKGREYYYYLTPCSHPGEEETRVPSTSKVMRVENEETA